MKDFRLSYLLKLSYISNRLKTLRSPEDLLSRLKNFWILFYKIITGKYSKKSRKKETCRLLQRALEAHPESERSYILSVPPYKVFWNWDINTGCNYRCPYCFYKSHQDDNTLFLKPEEWGKVWRNIFDKWGETHIHIAGGEPSAYPYIEDTLLRLSEFHTLEISTNLSLNYSELISKLPPERLKFNASYHRDFSDEEAFLSKIRDLEGHGFFVSVSTVAYPGYDMGFLREFMIRVNNAGSSLVIQPFRGSYKDNEYPEGYTQEEKLFLEELSQNSQRLNHSATSVNKRRKRPYLAASTENVNELIQTHIQRNKELKGIKCRMGQMYGKIYPDGSVYRCCAPDTVKIGNILDPELKLLTSARSCEASKCPCYKRMTEGDEKFWESYWPIL